jgi:hypothetical protein
MVNPKIEDCREYIENAVNPQAAGHLLTKTGAAVVSMR